AKQSAAAVDVQEVTVKQKQDEMNIVSKAEADPPAANLLNHEMQVTLAPNEGTEIKVKMDKGKQVNYTWWTDGGRANFDIHGDSKELNIDYHNYSKGSQQKSEGVLVAAFDGNHGWFWRNRTPETITVTLQTNGEYTNIKHIE
ncbi:MAG: transmembrane anchor protein, partial [Rhodospirillaceae bacterium]|nr:transmembrane anchor protein [Rhodospirillaceae bacterium]